MWVGVGQAACLMLPHARFRGLEATSPDSLKHTDTYPAPQHILFY